MRKTTPAIFLDHGNPMNTLEHNAWTDGWSAIGREIPKPKAVLAVSAHWYVPYTSVTAMPKPRTIHDFGGFPRQLYEVKYPAPAAPDLAARMQNLLAPISVGLDMRWGLDHGTWSVLFHVFPHADVPVIQLSIDNTQPASFHYETGKRLAPFRDEGVLIIGSGNLVHNLHAYAWGQRHMEPFDWAVQFEDRVRELLLAHEDVPLIEYEELGSDGMLSVPTPDHYLPLLYVIALRRNHEQVSFPIKGFDGGSISMLAVKIG
ncbi:MAG TPA: 4,5-DOPA dioxygenase extradiol [Syntrophales bacterium]|nr:4,5-DOPA dioxygenase extradiol [Syntrophales bacterium]